MCRRGQGRTRDGCRRARARHRRLIRQPRRQRIHQTAGVAGHEDAVVALVARHLGTAPGRILPRIEPDARIGRRNRLATGQPMAGCEDAMGRLRGRCSGRACGGPILTGAQLAHDRCIVMHAGAAGQQHSQQGGLHTGTPRVLLRSGTRLQARRPASCPLVHPCTRSVSLCNDNIGPDARVGFQTLATGASFGRADQQLTGYGVFMSR